MKKKIANVTVIVPCWNYGMFLTACLESILAQTVMPEQIIVMDDHSSDDSFAIATDYAFRYPDLFTVIRNDSNLGTLGNEIKAANMVKTDWMFFLDADDMIKPTYIERGAEFFNSDERLAIIYSDMEKFGNWSGTWEVSEWNEDILRGGNYINGHAFIKKKIYDEAGGLRPHVNGSTDFFEDYQLWIDIIDLKKNYYGRRIPEALIMYRRHDFGHRTDRTDKEKRK